MSRLVGQPLRLPTGRRGACSTKKHTLMYCSQRTFSFEQRRMRVIKAAVDRVRGKIAQILLAQFAQRLNKWLCLTRCHVRECICLVFETARPHVKERRQPETYCARQQRKQQHRMDDLHCHEEPFLLETKRPIKSLLTFKP